MILLLNKPMKIKISKVFLIYYFIKILNAMDTLLKNYKSICH